MPTAVPLAALVAAIGLDDPYRTRDVRGWEVVVHRDLLDGAPGLADRTLDLLDRQLAEVARAVPAGALAKLRTVRIWVELDEPHHPCMAYHPSADWLRAHGMDPRKARCVEVADARNFLEWTRQQPWMVLHELAHAYHHQFLPGGFENAEVHDAYRASLDAGRYGEVLHIDGRRRPSYAATNPMEYFAECSEAYFGTNDFEPFVRAELERYDERMTGLLERLWDPPDGDGAADRSGAAED